MTREEFIAIVQLHPERINVWYDNTLTTIYGISVPVLDNTDQDITNYLTQAQQLGVPLPSGGSVVLPIVARQLVSAPVNNIQVTCFYFDVTPTSVTITGSTNTGSIQLYPAIDSAEFYDSPYNTLHGSIEELRTSTYIMQSDRYKVGTLANPTYTGPLNIAELIIGSASLAHVQDSNYTIAGWVNGRYEGSKTSRVDYRTDPAIGGSIFKGAEFPKGTTTTQINYLQSSGQIFYKDIFFAGTGDTPGYYPVPSGYMYTGSAALTANATTMTITQQQYAPSTVKIPTPGDIFQLSDERVKVISVATIPLPWLRYTLTVERGYNSTTAPHDNGTPVYYVQPVQIYNILGNKLTGVPKGDVVVQQTGQLLNLDSLGYIVTSSFVLEY